MTKTETNALNAIFKKKKKDGFLKTIGSKLTQTTLFIATVLEGKGK